jgi:hypothetical protein
VTLIEEPVELPLPPPVLHDQEPSTGVQPVT